MNWLKPLAVVLGSVALGVMVWMVTHQYQYVTLCNAAQTECSSVKAEYTYDGMDGQFVIRKLYTTDGVKTFGPTDCWVARQGSQCMNSSTNQNTTGFDGVILPMAIAPK